MSTQVWIGPLSINSYNLWIGLAVIAGFGISILRAQHARVAAFNGGLIVLAGALFLGRAGYAVLNLPYFAEHVGEILSNHSPGFSEQAAIVGGLIGWRLAQRLGQSVDPLGLIVGAALAGVGASVGCVPNGCAYGQEVFWTDGAAWALRVDWPDATLIHNPRLPTQVFMAAWLTACLLAALILLRAGSRFFFRTFDACLWPVLVWVAFFALGDFAVQFARADPAPIWLGLRAPQWADIALLGIAAVLALRWPPHR